MIEKKKRRRRIRVFKPPLLQFRFVQAIRLAIIVLSACVGLLLVGYAGYRGYNVWKQSHAMSMARMYFTKADLPNTLLSLRQVLIINPRNVEACRMEAILAEAGRSREALLWRQRVLEINPKSFEDRISLAQAAVIFHDYLLATNTLAGMDDAGKQTPTYHNVAGAAALMGGLLDAAEAHFSESIRLDPDNPAPQVNLATVRLQRTNALDMAEARIDLQRIILNSTNTVLCSEARRELVNDALRFTNQSTALKLSKELVEQPDSVFEDKLLRLDVLMKVNSDEFKPALAMFQREAANNPAKLYYMASWQADSLSRARALAWLKSLPPRTRTNQPATLLIAEYQLKLDDWHELQVFLQPQDWKELEYVRHAYLARSLREQGLTEASVAEWTAALNLATNEKRSLNGLLDLAAKWEWNTEAEQLLWTIVNKYPDEKGAARMLEQSLFTGHRARSLMKLFDLMCQRSPDNLEAKNNLAMMAMLLGAQELKPYELARNVYEKVPTNSIFASTYAFSLYLQKKYPEALHVLQKVPHKDLANPSLACYYGLILKANGDKAEARSYLNQSKRANLLPEERAMFDKASVGL